MVLDFLSESALLAAGEVLDCRAFCNRPLLNLIPPSIMGVYSARPQPWLMTWLGPTCASRAQIKVSFYSENDLFT